MIGSSLVHTWLLGPLEILFPRECVVCTRPLRGASLCFRCTPASISFANTRCTRCFGVVAGSEGGTCAACEAFPLTADRVRYLWEYEGIARDFIRAMKYQPSPFLAYRAGDILAQHLPSLFGSSKWDLIIPVPSSPAMLKKRLFHPCAEMTRAIQKHLPGVAVRHALHHRGGRTPQARRSHRERLQGFKRIFDIRNGKEVAGRRILLVEDVITTGATVAAACHALSSAGVRSVDVLALAEARVWRRFRSRVYALSES